MLKELKQQYELQVVSDSFNFCGKAVPCLALWWDLQ